MLPLLHQPPLSGFRLVAYHRRGYGNSGRVSAPVTMADQAEDALGLLDRLDVDRAHLVGHSVGGTIALQLALTCPERVSTLVLLEVSIHGERRS